jgi:hypothetical protein
MGQQRELVDRRAAMAQRYPQRTPQDQQRELVARRADLAEMYPPGEIQMPPEDMIGIEMPPTGMAGVDPDLLRALAAQWEMDDRRRTRGM